MRWPALLLATLLAVSGCKRTDSTVPGTGTGGGTPTPAKKKAISREEGERKYNRLGEVLPVRSALADVVRYFGQEPDRWEGKDPDRKAIWVLDDGSEIAIEFYNGLSGSDSATFKNKP